MQSEFKLTVGDVLDHPLFQKARIVAGKEGLSRRIRWVHILEISNFDTLIHGEEMILSTGVGLHWGKYSETAYLEKLIQHNASCLCLELGPYFDNVSKEMIDMANEHDFPLIVFQDMVRFVDITQELHSLVINQHHKMLKDLEKVSTELHRLTLTSQGTSNILKLLHESTKTQAIYLPEEGNHRSVPPLATNRQTELITFLRHQSHKMDTMEKTNPPYRLTYEDSTLLLEPVGAIGQNWGHLILVLDNREPEEFDLLVLDRASISLSQDLLRKRYIDERKLHMENLWVNDLIHNRLNSEEEIRAQMDPQIRQLVNHKYRICLIELIMQNTMDFQMLEEEQESTRIYTALLTRSVFEKHAFHPLITTKGNQLIVIAVDLNPNTSQKERLKKVFHTLEAKKLDEKTKNLQVNVGVGRTYSKFTDTYLSYQEAQHVLKINNFNRNQSNAFYEDLGVHRLLLHLGQDHIIQPFIDDYIGPLIEYDRTKGNELLRTLHVYFKNNGSKKLTAEKLFVARQTLYHRLNKIKELLGQDFMSRDKRVSIEVAIQAYRLIQPEVFTKSEQGTLGD